ncbi:MAG TPA: hypothetical protein DCF68_21315 [Cyanothece sp. UBA12306]|nr:hypothetical protein [Cyanothece sp. UBA12306]
MKINQKNIKYLLWILIAIAVTLRVANLASREFWYDEILSLLLSTGQKINYQSPGDAPVILANYSKLLQLPVENSLTNVLQTVEKLLKGLVAEPHPPLFFLGQHFWLRLWGNSELAMRSIIALFSLGSMGCAYGLGRLLLGNQGGLIFAIFLGLNPYHLFHSLNVRMYSSLVFWTILSSWSLLELINLNNTQKTSNEINSNKSLTQSKILWILLLIISVIAGFMTFYYFAYFVLTLGIIVLYLDRQRWWQYAIYLASSIIITTPWLWWGTRQQLRNADLGRFATSNNFLEAILKHLQDLIQVLGIHLIIGDWVSVSPPSIITIMGIGAIACLSFCSWSLWKHEQYRLLMIGLLLGIFPLLLMLTIDLITGKFTVGFGWGRSVIFILSGCLLLLVIWLEKVAKKSKNIIVIAIIGLYLTLNLVDFSLRNRSMFHDLANIINQQKSASTLIVLNSQAWGHVLRLAYYLPDQIPLSLLAQNSEILANNLEKTLINQPQKYQRLLWLDSQRPVWGKPSTEEQKKQIQEILNKHFELERSQFLFGTWELDNFDLKVYQSNK